MGNSWGRNQDGEPQRNIARNLCDLHASTHRHTHMYTQTVANTCIYYTQKENDYCHYTIHHSATQCSLSLLQSHSWQAHRWQVASGASIALAGYFRVETRRLKFQVWLPPCAHCIHTTESENHKYNLGTISNVLFSRFSWDSAEAIVGQIGLYSPSPAVSGPLFPEGIPRLSQVEQPSVVACCSILKFHWYRNSIFV